MIIACRDDSKALLQSFVRGWMVHTKPQCIFIQHSKRVTGNSTGTSGYLMFWWVDEWKKNASKSVKHAANALKVLSCVSLGTCVYWKRSCIWVIHVLSGLMLCTGISYFCLFVSAAIALARCMGFITLKNYMYMYIICIIVCVLESCIKHVQVERRLIQDSGLSFLTLWLFCMNTDTLGYRGASLFLDIESHQYFP